MILKNVPACVCESARTYICNSRSSYIPLFLLWTNLSSVNGGVWHLLPSNCLISKHHVIIIKCVCVSGRGNLSEFTQWKVTCGELPIWQLVSRDLYAYLCPPFSHGQGVYVFSVQILSWLSAPVTGTQIILYILMMSFWRGMALQLTDLHWYTRFYAIPTPSGCHWYGQPTVVSGEHSRSKTSAIIAMYDVSTTRVFVRYRTKSHS